MNLTPEQQKTFRKMDDLWTVRRVRQKLQHKGLYEATQQVKKERLHKSMVISQNIPRTNSEQAEKLLKYRPKPWGE